MDPLVQFTEHIMQGAKVSKQRTGQYLVNHLPEDLVAKLTQTSFDPYEKQLSTDEIFNWIDNHLIFDHNHIIALFDGDDILWEQAPPDMAVPAVVS